MSFFPSNTKNLLPREPFSVVIEDSFGRTFTLVKRPSRGDILTIEESREKGQYGSIAVNGRFHDDARQTDIDTIHALASMEIESQRRRNLLTLHMAFPRVSVRGYIENVRGPRWGSREGLKWFHWSFDFVREPKPFVPVKFKDASSLIAEEGLEHSKVAVDTDHTNLEDLVYDHRERSFRDEGLMGPAISRNLLIPARARNLIVGEELDLDNK